MCTRVAMLSLVLLGTTSCRMNYTERTSGTVIGAAGGTALGALVGGAVGNPWLGAGLGAAAGGAAGYIVGDKIADKRERQSQSAPQASGSGSAPETTSFPPPAADIEPAPAPGATRPPAAGHPPEVYTTSGPSQDRLALARAEYDAGRAAKTAPEALRHYDNAIRLDPSRPEPYNARGMVLQYEGKKDEARRAYKQALAIDPGYAPAEQSLRALAASR